MLDLPFYKNKPITLTENSDRIILFLSDIDECTENGNPCDENAECFNDDGSFACICKDGFTRNGTVCLGELSFTCFRYRYVFRCYRSSGSSSRVMMMTTILLITMMTFFVNYVLSVASRLTFEAFYFRYQ